MISRHFNESNSLVFGHLALSLSDLSLSALMNRPDDRERGWGFPGSFETERAIKESWVKLGSVSDRVRVRDLMRRYGISLGNAETIQLASEKKAELALADEAEVRELLEEHGVKARGCIGVLIEAAKKRIISTNQAKKGLRDLVDSGYRVGDTVLNQAYKLLGEEK